MYRTFVILRHTFREAIVQPIFSLILGLGAAIMVIFGYLPFFTLGEDTVMFMSVGLDVILLLVLIATLFATSKSIFDEIEDRTMLTLMSKPVARWEVIVGKYLGIVLAAFLAVAVLGGVMCLATWLRIPTDYQIQSRSLDDRELYELYSYRIMHISGLVPSLFMVWLEICALAAVGVALSTRFSLVVNLPIVIFVYIAGNLTRFLFPLSGSDAVMRDRSIAIKFIAAVVRSVLPALGIFDLKARTIHSRLAVKQFASDPNAVHLSTIWGYVGLSTAYAIAFAAFALAVGMWLFQSRELGGAEG